MDREAWRAVVVGLQRVGRDWVTELNWLTSLLSQGVLVTSILAGAWAGVHGPRSWLTRVCLLLGSKGLSAESLAGSLSPEPGITEVVSAGGKSHLVSPRKLPNAVWVRKRGYQKRPAGSLFYWHGDSKQEIPGDRDRWASCAGMAAGSIFRWRAGRLFSCASPSIFWRQRIDLILTSVSPFLFYKCLLIFS